MKVRQLVLIILLLVSGLPESAVGQNRPATKFQGFLGTYHPFKGTAYGGSGWTEGELLQRAFAFGENAIISQASYNGYTFGENAANSCNEWDVNKIYGILRPPTEKGVVNQPKDVDPVNPFQREPGMVQGAKRFSELSKRCPQISGIVIDDFFNDYPKLLSIDDLREIKGAVLGKTVDEKGKVEHSSPATTPDLKLYIVVYEHQLSKAFDAAVLDLIDGVSFWTWRQSENYQNFDDHIDTVRRVFPGKEIIAGVYVFNGLQTPSVVSVHHIIGRAIDSYSSGKINGLLVFSAVWMSRERSARERWNELALPQLLNRVYYGSLGEGSGRVVDAKTRKPIARALITITRLVEGKSLVVARKFSDEKGEYRFGGWAGRNGRKRGEFEIRVESGSFKPLTRRTKLRAGESLLLPEAILRR